MKHFARFVALTALTVGGSAVADPATLAPARPILVKSQDPCATNCEWIALQGTIDAETLTGFSKIVARLGPARPPVFVNSGGGDVRSAMAIGRLIRAHGLDVAVGATTLEDEIAKPARLATPGTLTTMARAYCASACSFVLSGGVHRYVAYNAFVGLHEMVQPEQYVPQQVRYYQTRTWTRNGRVVRRETRLVGSKYSFRHLARKRSPESAYREAASYYAKMGLDAEKAVALMKTAAPENITWLTESQLNETKLATERKSAEALLGIVKSTAVAMPFPIHTPRVWSGRDSASSKASATTAAPMPAPTPAAKPALDAMPASAPLPEARADDLSLGWMLGGFAAFGFASLTLILRRKPSA